MAWNELTALRTERSRSYQDNGNSNKRCWDGIQAPIHHQSILDSGVYDAEIDMTPVRMDNPQFDGWRIVENDWHYAVGKDLVNHGDQDGWVGFGGRQGQHWFKFRLLRLGYLHWPTRTFEDIGGPPTYDRANLDQRVGTLTIGPDDDEIHVGGVHRWDDIWETPGGGSLSVQWRPTGDGLKEDIVIDQAGREWIETNAPPSTPLDETYFGFVIRADWSDIPRVYRANILQDLEDDFADDGETIEMRDALDRLLAFMPVSEVRVLSTEDFVPDAVAPLRKRFWKGGDGNHYLLVGVRCDTLAAMPEGDLVFDPTVDKQVGVGADDGRRYTGTGGFSSAEANFYLGYSSNSTYLDMHGFFRWTDVTISGTVTTSYIEIYAHANGSGAPEHKVYGVDEDNPAAPTSAAEFDADVLTTNSVDWDGAWTANNWEQSPSLNSIFNELIASYTIAGDAVMVQVKNDGGAVVKYNQAKGWEFDDNSKGAKLHIEYTGGRIPRPPAAYNTLAMY